MSNKYRVQVNAQATVYEKTGRMVTETATISGLVIPNQVEEEREFECKQVAFGFKLRMFFWSLLVNTQLTKQVCRWVNIRQ